MPHCRPIAWPVSPSPISDALAGSGYLLTGDAGVVQLDVRVFYKVTEPYAFVLQGEHVLPALDRLVTRSALALTAARDSGHHSGRTAGVDRR